MTLSSTTDPLFFPKHERCFTKYLLFIQININKNRYWEKNLIIWAKGKRRQNTLCSKIQTGVTHTNITYIVSNHIFAVQRKYDAVPTVEVCDRWRHVFTSVGRVTGSSKARARPCVRNDVKQNIALLYTAGVTFIETRAHTRCCAVYVRAESKAYLFTTTVMGNNIVRLGTQSTTATRGVLYGRNKKPNSETIKRRFWAPCTCSERKAAERAGWTGCDFS